MSIFNLKQFKMDFVNSRFNYLGWSVNTSTLGHEMDVRQEEEKEEEEEEEEGHCAFVIWRLALAPPVCSPLD